MRILFFIDSLNIGGKERRLTELIKGLQLVPDLNMQIILMNKKIHYAEILELNIKIHYLIRNSKKDLSIFYKAYKIFKSVKPDIVYCANTMTTIYSIPACQLLRIKLVNAMISNAPDNLNYFTLKLWRAKMTFPFSNIIIANSQAGLDVYKVPKRKRRLIRNGFNFDRILNISDPVIIRNEINAQKKFIVGMVASHSEKKDYKTFVKSAERLLLKRNDTLFLLIGANTDSKDLKNSISKGNDQYFRFLGKKTNIESYINIMNVCVLATFTEGISNSILEYMALSKPVIATKGGGTQEIVEDGVTGFLIDVNDDLTLAEKCNLLLENNDLRIQMGNLAKEKIVSEFSIDKMVDNTLKVYKNYLN